MTIKKAENIATSPRPRCGPGAMQQASASLWRDLAAMAYRLWLMVARLRLLVLAPLAGALCACAPTLGPPPPGIPIPDESFRAGDFAWSQTGGHNAIMGRLAAQTGPVRYTCAGSTVVLTPETPWSRRRMIVLYKSDLRSALPTNDVRGRTSLAPPGDSDPFVRRATCDSADRFSFANLPDGAWYVVTIAKPAAGAQGESMALMRRVVTRGGKAVAAEL